MTKDNLKELGNSLNTLDLSNNFLTSIEENLFEYNSNLVFVHLTGNPLRQIDPDFFTNLKKLKTTCEVIMSSAGCMNQFFHILYDDDIATYKWHIENCFDLTAKLEAKKLITDRSKCSHETMAEKKPEIKRK